MPLEAFVSLEADETWDLCGTVRAARNMDRAFARHAARIARKLNSKAFGCGQDRR